MIATATVIVVIVVAHPYIHAMCIGVRQSILYFYPTCLFHAFMHIITLWVDKPTVHAYIYTRDPKEIDAMNVASMSIDKAM
ncbi:hypothetical protein BDF22DRAFT_675655 [Syncephalis plumigaleata]|nr:hypothetical protein BDF22DRAFT_675655 [Syncephalis plumigaleata]